MPFIRSRLSNRNGRCSRETSTRVPCRLPPTWASHCYRTRNWDAACSAGAWTSHNSMTATCVVTSRGSLETMRIAMPRVGGGNPPRCPGVDCDARTGGIVVGSLRAVAHGLTGVPIPRDSQAQPTGRESRSAGHPADGGRAGSPGSPCPVGTGHPTSLSAHGGTIAAGNPIHNVAAFCIAPPTPQARAARYLTGMTAMASTSTKYSGWARA